MEHSSYLGAVIINFSCYLSVELMEACEPKLRLFPIILAIIAMKLGIIYTYNAAS